MSRAVGGEHPTHQQFDLIPVKLPRLFNPRLAFPLAFPHMLHVSYRIPILIKNRRTKFNIVRSLQSTHEFPDEFLDFLRSDVFTEDDTELSVHFIWLGSRLRMSAMTAEKSCFVRLGRLPRSMDALRL